jgi:hypothetical protein
VNTGKITGKTVKFPAIVTTISLDKGVPFYIAIGCFNHAT